MFNLKAGTLDLGNGRIEKIVRWEVQFRTPFGIAINLPEAVERVESCDLDPETCVLPTAVAITDSGEEIFLR